MTQFRLAVGWNVKACFVFFVFLLRFVLINMIDFLDIVGALEDKAINPVVPAHVKVEDVPNKEEEQ